ncbi:hypothetical protein SCLCIDRAFT_547996 [Scleroderma citrinum Foug A]|uniref:Uncharacterized protein n=1 Tax=Scleroderma citrinum Foug A TaxID=1036808 RepID=A0A0C3D934_9AGAM|nr:hypothetical protein SCLCIDRAFT_547996 [Scleroderma citrinum Foug A]
MGGVHAVSNTTELHFTNQGIHCKIFKGFLSKAQTLVQNATPRSHILNEGDIFTGCKRSKQSCCSCRCKRRDGRSSAWVGHCDIDWCDV